MLDRSHKRAGSNLPQTAKPTHHPIQHDIATRTRISKRPRNQRVCDWRELVTVVLLNDDDTYMGYVVKVLINIFGISPAYAESTMLTAHTKGVALVGIYTRNLAEELMQKVHRMNQRHGVCLEFAIIDLSNA